MIPAEHELLLDTAAAVTTVAWAMSIRTRYLAGAHAQTALLEAFRPALALTWAHQALMRILIP